MDSFPGSNFQVTFAGGVHTPGEPAEFGRPPPATHYSFYAVEYRRDAAGAILESYAFKFVEFEIQPVINTASPCFIDVEQTRFPGVHATRAAAKLRDFLGIDNPYAPGVDRQDAIDIITLDVRMENLGRLESAIKAVTTFSAAPLPVMDTVCVGEGGSNPGLVPPPRCIDDESNMRRFELCTQFWEENPLAYEGSDKVFLQPLNGRWFGAVTGNDPRNSAFLGGATFFVDTNLDQIDALIMNWQYDDVDGNGVPDYPDGFPTDLQSPIGFHYMMGTPVQKTRGTINIPLANDTFTSIQGEAVIFADLNDDDVHF